MNVILNLLETICHAVKIGFDYEFKDSFFDNEARKMMNQEIKFLSAPERKNLVEVLYRLYEKVNSSHDRVVVFQGMYQMVLVPYLLGLSLYNPFDAENCGRQESINNPRYIDIGFHTSKDGFESLYTTLYRQLG